ncbi:DUF4329 domain-containing protein [Muricoccus radiodurans]|uniref:DUF4329 domain-containing protein n=1 Tax=Muricoccus radiodurans TaxID=2231721 RepID=UPI003CFBB983
MGKPPKVRLPKVPVPGAHHRAAGQPKAAVTDEMKLENFARAELVKALPKSLRDPKTEHGAVICRGKHSGHLSATPLRSGTATSVDVGLEEPNCGCPEGTLPVAFFHTHPTAEADGGGGATLHGDPDFSEQDKRLANNNQIVAFLGSFDGKFRRYIPPQIPFTEWQGKRYLNATDENGKVLPEVFNETTELNGLLPKT